MDYQNKIEGIGKIFASAVTLGKFDGLHRGHQRLIQRILEQKKRGLKAVVFAFDQGSRTILTREERIQKLEKMGVDLFLECPLDQKMRHMKPEEFVKKILVDQLHVSYLAVGRDFHFGYERKGNPQLLSKMGEQYGFTVEIVPDEMDGRRKISSTYVREQLNEGNMEKVAQLLGGYFSTTGEVLHGRGLGHRKLMPTTNLIPPKEKLMPPNGVYITYSRFGDQSFHGITNVGYKPTVGGEEFLGVETYLFQCSQNLYGQKSVVSFLKFLRPERKFESLEKLKNQLMQDIQKAQKFFDEHSGSWAVNTFEENI